MSGPLHAQDVLPVLIDMKPSSGPAGAGQPITVILTGRHFQPFGNVVTFGPARINDVPSPDGTALSFDIPKTMPARGEVPPMVLSEGEYQVIVTTKAGSSNALIFKMSSGQ